MKLRDRLNTEDKYNYLLEDILKTAFKIYEDFKQVFLEIAEQK